MAREQAPAFQFYARDWLASASVAVMTLDERGAYITLLARCWLTVELPLEPDELAVLAGASKAWWQKHGDRVMRQFQSAETGYRHDRLDEERTKQEAFSAEQSRKAGLRWGTSRTDAEPMPRQSHGNAGAEPLVCSSSASASACTDPPSARVNATPQLAVPDDAPAQTYEHFRQRALAVRGATLPLTARPHEGQAAIELVTRYPDEARREALIESYLTSEHRDLRRSPPTMGQVAKWASWLEEQAPAEAPAGFLTQLEDALLLEGLTRHDVGMWFKGARVVQDQGDVVTVALASDDARRWVQKRWGEAIQAASERVRPGSRVELDAAEAA